MTGAACPAILSRGQQPKETDFLLTGGNPVGAVSAEASPAAGSDVDDDLVIKAGSTVHDIERKLIIETLKSTNDNRTQAAKMLGISIRTLRNKLNEYNKADLV